MSQFVYNNAAHGLGKNFRMIVDDGGRAAAGFTKERADCTVRAAAHAMGIDYASAHALLKKHGRKSKCGCKWKLMAPVLGFEIVPELSCRQLKSILPEMEHGRFVVRMAHHVFAVVDGNIYDHRIRGGGTRVLMTYRLVVPVAEVLARKP